MKVKENEKIKITGVELVALPGKIQEYIAKQQKSTKGIYYSVYFWLDEERALYLRGNTHYGRISGGFMGRLASQIGTQYFTGLETVLKGKTLIEAINEIKSCQIESKEFNWAGSKDELLKLLEVSV